MPAIVGHTITIWCSSFYRPLLGDDGFLVLPYNYDFPSEGERLIDHLRERWVDVERPNHDPGFNPSPVHARHVNGWASFTVRCVAHEGDDEIIERLIEEARTGWVYDDGSTPVRVHHMQDHLE